jgi:hypothetical protein
MTYAIPQGVQVSLDYNSTTGSGTWYKLSDHNRQPINISYTLIESTDRMANGTLRKYIVARKFIISAEWKDFPTLDSNLVDYDSSSPAYAGAWIKAFYEANAFQPIYVKLTFAQDEIPSYNNVPDSQTYLGSEQSTGQIYNAFMTTFTYEVTKRRLGYDYVNLKIEFTEV